MKTKTFNHFRNLFAFVGFFIIACSAAVDDSPPAVEPPVVQNNIGKYQVAGMSDDNYIVILNTESGKLKSYYRQNNQWNEFNEGDLTVSH
jgi:hypothetical protein